MFLIRQTLCFALQAYMIVLFARAILSWFPLEPGTTFFKIGEFLVRVTDPLLVPLRRIVPRTGMLDLSFLVLFLILIVASYIICPPAGL